MYEGASYPRNKNVPEIKRKLEKQDKGMDKKLISIIVPVYNIEEYLPRCIESILNQTYTNLELILVNDGSTDKSGSICEKYATKDKRVRVIHKKNGGSSSARNAGIREAKGEYLGFVDSDDYIENTMYEKMVEAIDAVGANIVQVARDEIDEKGNLMQDICKMPDERITYTAEEFLKELLLHIGDCSFCTKLLKRDLFFEEQFPEGVLNEDFHLIVKLLCKKENVVSLPYCGYHVFYRIGSNTRKKDKNDFSRVYADNVDNADMVLELVNKHFPLLTKIALRFGLYQRMDYLLHIPIAMMTKENVQYRNICKYVRKHWMDTIVSKYLTQKDKLYLTLFAVMPKGIRKIHAFMKRL